MASDILGLIEYFVAPLVWIMILRQMLINIEFYLQQRLQMPQLHEHFLEWRVGLLAAALTNYLCFTVIPWILTGLVLLFLPLREEPVQETILGELWN